MQNNPFSRLQWLAITLALVMTGLSAYYWNGLLQGHEQLKTDRLAAANRRAVQLANAKASELDALIRGLDATLRQFRDGYVASGRDAAGAVAESAVRAFPPGAIPFLSIIDAKGNVTYSTATTQSIYVGDREYFSLHQGNPADQLGISKPLAGRRDGNWVVMLTRPVLKQQQFAGVVAVALSIDFLSQRLAQLEIDQNDVINVFFADGAYLARSRDWQEMMGKKLPEDRPFLDKNAPSSGVFSITAMVDQYRRIYAWQRLDSYPLILTIGLAQTDLLDPVDRLVATSRRQNAVAIFLGLLLVYVIAWLLFKNAQQHDKLLELATTDELTGFSNRRHFVSRLQEEIARTKRMEGYHASVLMLDVDFFKKINDTYGHIAGDQVLREFAAVIRKNLRKIDMAGRLGGEEFAVILPGAGAEAAKLQAERLCLEIRATSFVTKTAVIPVTVSIGVTSIAVTDDAPDTVLGHADSALYMAKQNGRDRVEVALPSAMPSVE